MGVFEMLVAIVAVVAAAGIIKAAIKARHGGSLSPAHETRIRKLEERVKALEEVVSDKSFELKEKLRELES